MSSAPLLILAVGNPSRGDDAVGPVLAEQLSQWLEHQAPQVQHMIEVITDQQLVVEHVYDLQHRHRVLVIDAAAQGDQAVCLIRVEEQSPPGPVSTHSSTPQQLLGLHRALLNEAPPPTELLTITGHDFELGAALSTPVQRALPKAWETLHGWISMHIELCHA